MSSYIRLCTDIKNEIDIANKQKQAFQKNLGLIEYDVEFDSERLDEELSNLIHLKISGAYHP